MGKIEDKIKEDLMGTIFTDSFRIYEFIDGRFRLSEEERTLIISKINSLNNDLTNILREIKLS